VELEQQAKKGNDEEDGTLNEEHEQQEGFFEETQSNHDVQGNGDISMIPEASEYQFTSQSKKIINLYNRYKLKRSKSLYNELMHGDVARDWHHVSSGSDTEKDKAPFGTKNEQLLSEMDEDLFSVVAASEEDQDDEVLRTEGDDAQQGDAPAESTTEQSMQQFPTPTISVQAPSSVSRSSPLVHSHHAHSSASTPVDAISPSIVNKPLLSSSESFLRVRKSPSTIYCSSSNQALLDANLVLPPRLRNFALTRVLQPSELVLWADCSLYSASKGKALRNCVVLYLSSFILSMIFTIIAAYLVEHPLDALSTSFMGLISSVIPFLVGVYYTNSLTSLNTLYMITNKRIIFCRKKGFFREKLKPELVSFDELPGAIQVTRNDNMSKYVKNVGVYGNLLFQHNFQVLNQASRLWRLNENKSTFKGFASVAHVGLLEELMTALIALKKTLRERHADGEVSPH